MGQLGNHVRKIRSKNAGPFCVTIDMFCHDRDSFDWLVKALPRERVAQMYRVEENQLEFFAIPSLNVIKISMPRPHIQGSRLDRDMHGAQFAELLIEMNIPTPDS